MYLNKRYLRKKHHFVTTVRDSILHSPHCLLMAGAHQNLKAHILLNLPLMHCLQLLQPMLFHLYHLLKQFLLMGLLTIFFSQLPFHAIFSLKLIFDVHPLFPPYGQPSSNDNLHVNSPMMSNMVVNLNDFPNIKSYFDLLPCPPPCKFKKSYNHTQKFQLEWVTKLLWVEGVLAIDGVFTMRKLCPQQLNYLTTRVPKQLIYNCITIVPWKYDKLINKIPHQKIKELYCSCKLVARYIFI